MRRDVAAKLDDDLPVPRQRNRRRRAPPSPAVDEHRHRPAERQKARPAETASPDAEQVAERVARRARDFDHARRRRGAHRVGAAVRLDADSGGTIATFLAAKSSRWTAKLRPPLVHLIRPIGRPASTAALCAVGW